MQVVLHQMIYSPERTHNDYYEPLLVQYPAIDSNNLLTLLAADLPSLRPKWWVLLHFSSCFPHLCWVPTDSFPWSKVGQAL